MDAVIVSMTTAPLIADEKPLKASSGDKAARHMTKPERNRTIRGSYCFTKAYIVTNKMIDPMISSTQLTSL